MKWSKRAATFLVHHGVINEVQVDWFIYGVEKRIASVCMIPPFFLLALFWTSPLCALSFFASFYLLRQRMSGYHARTMGLCLFLSLILEVLFFGFVYPILQGIRIFIVIGICLLLIFILAPFNHPNMNFTDIELSAYRSSARSTACILSLTSVVTYFIGIHEITRGLSIGIAMATFLLCIAYILEWRNKHD